MIVRLAEKRDINAILNLLQQVNLIHHRGRPDLFNIGTKYTAEQLSKIIEDEKRPILVADDNGIVKGYAFCMLQFHEHDTILTNIKTLYIDDLCINEKDRGKHIGKTLYNAVLNLAKNLDCYNVTLNVWSLNSNAIKFYEACGMKQLKICMEQIIQSQD